MVCAGPRGCVPGPRPLPGGAAVLLSILRTFTTKGPLAPAPTSQVVYLRVYATRVTTSTTGRTVSSDGITLRLAGSGGRWLVSAVLFY